MKKNHGMKTIADQMRKRLQQKQMTGVGIGSVILKTLQQYARYPNEMTITFSNGVVRIKLIEGEDKTKWFHMRESYRDDLNKKLISMGYNALIKTIKVQ